MLIEKMKNERKKRLLKLENGVQVFCTKLATIYLHSKVCNSNTIDYLSLSLYIYILLFYYKCCVSIIRSLWASPLLERRNGSMHRFCGTCSNSNKTKKDFRQRGKGIAQPKRRETGTKAADAMCFDNL